MEWFIDTALRIGREYGLMQQAAIDARLRMPEWGIAMRGAQAMYDAKFAFACEMVGISVGEGEFVLGQYNATRIGFPFSWKIRYPVLPLVDAWP